MVGRSRFILSAAFLTTEMHKEKEKKKLAEIAFVDCFWHAPTHTGHTIISLSHLSVFIKMPKCREINRRNDS